MFCGGSSSFSSSSSELESSPWRSSFAIKGVGGEREGVGDCFVLFVCFGRMGKGEGELRVEKKRKCEMVESN